MQPEEVIMAIRGRVRRPWANPLLLEGCYRCQLGKGLHFTLVFFLFVYTKILFDYSSPQWIDVYMLFGGKRSFESTPGQDMAYDLMTLCPRFSLCLCLSCFLSLNPTPLPIFSPQDSVLRLLFKTRSLGFDICSTCRLLAVCYSQCPFLVVHFPFLQIFILFFLSLETRRSVTFNCI